MGAAPKTHRWINGHLAIIADVLIAIATLITSIVACNISKVQTEISRSQLEAQKKENQPLFEIRKSYLDYDNDGVLDTECFRMNITKNDVRNIHNIHIQTYFKLDVTSHNNEVNTIFVPVLDYYKSYGLPYHLTGEVLSDTTPDNFKAFIDFQVDCITKGINERVMKRKHYSCNKIDFFVIEYTDIYGDYRKECFEDTSYCTQERFFDIDQQSKEVFGYNSFVFNYFSLEEVLNYRKDLLPEGL